MQVVAPSLRHSDWLYFSGVYGTLLTFALVPTRQCGLTLPGRRQLPDDVLLTYKKMKLSIFETYLI